MLCILFANVVFSLQQVNRSKLGEQWTYASIAATNAGGIRNMIDEVAIAGGRDRPKTIL